MGKRKLLNLKVIGHSPKLLNEFINDNKSNIFKETFSGIKHAIRQNKNIAEICSVNTDVAVTYDKIFTDDSQRNAFEERYEDLLGNLDELW